MSVKTSGLNHRASVRALHFDNWLAGVLVCLSNVKLIFSPEDILVARDFDSETVFDSTLASLVALVSESYSLAWLCFIKEAHVVESMVGDGHVIRLR